jgi:hypothetical protein
MKFHTVFYLLHYHHLTILSCDLHGLRLPVGAGTTNKREFHIEDTTYRSDDEVTRELRTLVYTVSTGLLINPFLVEVIKIW